MATFKGGGVPLNETLVEMLPEIVFTTMHKHPCSDSGRFGVYPAGLQVWEKRQVCLLYCLMYMIRIVCPSKLVSLQIFNISGVYNIKNHLTLILLRLFS